MYPCQRTALPVRFAADSSAPQRRQTPGLRSPARRRVDCRVLIRPSRTARSPRTKYRFLKTGTGTA